MIRRLALAPFLLVALAGPATGEGLRLTTADLDAVLADDAQPSPSVSTYSASSSAPRRWWPLLASAVMPGLGEVATGHLRGIPMMAADAVVWVGVYKKQQDGNDKEEDFEAFADLHWSQEEWRKAVESGESSPDGLNFSRWFPDYAGGSIDDIPLYVSREVDEREWYENAGKWDEFAWGWREYWDFEWNEVHNPGFPGADFYAPQPNFPSTWFFSDNALMTPLRKDYIGMRDDSNSAFETRDTLLSAALLLRVVSVLQVVYLEGFVGRRYDAAEPVLGMGTPTASWTADSVGSHAGTLAWRLAW